MVGTVLENAPHAPHGPQGAPLYGTYQGVCSTTSLDQVAARAQLGRARQLFARKRWQWFGAFGQEVAVGGALVDLGYAAQVFCWVFDRSSGVMLADVSHTLPSSSMFVTQATTSGVLARCKLFSSSLQITRHGHVTHVSGKLREIELALNLDDGPTTPMTAICPLPGGRTNLTQKQAGLRASGWVRVDGQQLELGDEGVGLLDYSHGLLERSTSWLWGIGAGVREDGARVGFNFIEGFNAGFENVVWIDGEPRGVREVSFSFDERDPAKPWTITDSAGLIDLCLTPEGVRIEDIDLGLAASNYEQPLGRWTGRIGDASISALGVAERHFAKW